MSFFARLEERAQRIDSLLCVGLDPRVPVEEIVSENRRIIEATREYALCFKPNSAFYEQHGPAGLRALQETLSLVPDEIPVLLDAKRGDIGSTAQAYARACIHYGVDAVTVNPYMGEDSVRPFVDSGLAVFVLCRTSNPGSREFQALRVGDAGTLSVEVARTTQGWQGEVGLVVAGNDAAALAEIRAIRPETWFLAPGIGAQGGSMQEALLAGSREDGKGLLLAASRAISGAADPAEAARSLVEGAREVRGRAVGSGQEGRAGSSAYGPGPSGESAIPASVRDRLLDAILDTGGFRVGEFTLKSGAISPFYVDLRRLQSMPGALETAAMAYEALLPQSGSSPIDRVAAIPVAAVSLATALSLRTRLPLIYPRLPPKPHGTGNRVEGEWKAGERVVLVDDLITTGLSKIEAVKVLREEGMVVKDLLVLLQRSRANPEIEDAGLLLRAAARVEDLVERALVRGLIGQDDAGRVYDYLDTGSEGA